MNRSRSPLRTFCQHVPRERGDEPTLLLSGTRDRVMFPASAGMNRVARSYDRVGAHVPRERGDEPRVDVIVADTAPCSPRARG